MYPYDGCAKASGMRPSLSDINSTEDQQLNDESRGSDGSEILRDGPSTFCVKRDHAVLPASSPEPCGQIRPITSLFLYHGCQQERTERVVAHDI